MSNPNSGTGSAEDPALPSSPTIAAPGWFDDGTGLRRWWDGNAWTDSYAAPSKTAAVVPGRVPGFVLALIGAFLVAVPLLCLPLAITGWVLSQRALKWLPVGTAGRGLAVAGLVLGITATAMTFVFILLSIPGAYRANFG